MERFVDLAGCGVRGDRSDILQVLTLLGVDSLRAQFDSVDSERPQPCPYTRTLYANQLRDPRVADVLRGKHVLLGVSIRGIPDLVASPVQGQLPGVYWHAMALDNLLTQEAGYWRDAPSVFGDFSWTDLLELLLVLVATLVALLLPEAANMPDRKKRFVCWLLSHYLFWFVALSGVAILASGLLMSRWHIAPLDWLGLTLAIGLFYAYLGEPRVADWWAHLIDRNTAKQGETGCSEPQ
ncbi:CHASE2 domain protein [compost metagenome]